jgi:mRNA interferase MazF
MPLPYLPNRGEILICDFDTGFREPEMVKKRPAIVVSSKASHGRRLCTVVPLSTTAPVPPKPWHHPLPHVTVPGWIAAATMWAKCDMLATVSFDRLNKPYIKTQQSGRKYVGVFLCDEDMTAINECLRAYLRL